MLYGPKRWCLMHRPVHRSCVRSGRLRSPTDPLDLHDVTNVGSGMCGIALDSLLQRSKITYMCRSKCSCRSIECSIDSERHCLSVAESAPVSMVSRSSCAALSLDWTCRIEERFGKRRLSERSDSLPNENLQQATNNGANGRYSHRDSCSKSS